MKISLQYRSGYTFIMSVLVVGTIATSVAAALLLTGTTIARSTISIEQSAQAWANANVCIEEAIRSLRLDLGYIGDETKSFSNGSCTILPIGGAGNASRSLCVEGIYNTLTRRFQIKIATIFPDTTINSWEETPEFTLCSY